MNMFPKTKWVGKATLTEQFEHMKSEIDEIEEALCTYIIEPTKENRIKLIKEIIDLKHSADTELRNLEVEEEEHMILSNEVIRGNFERGYYKLD